jgi:hypothetical protein
MLQIAQQPNSAATPPVLASMTTPKTQRSRLAILLVVGLIVLCGGCGSCGMCRNYEVVRLKSPDGVLDAVLYQRDCGATTDFSTQVSIVISGRGLPDAPANVFIADANHGVAPRASWGGPPATIAWQGNRDVIVRYHPASRVGRAYKEVNVSVGWFDRASVTIEFVATENLATLPTSALTPPPSAVTAIARRSAAGSIGGYGCRPDRA